MKSKNKGIHTNHKSRSDHNLANKRLNGSLKIKTSNGLTEIEFCFCTYMCSSQDSALVK